MASTFSTTTRLTSPPPTGFDKMKQDHWDMNREKQIRTKMLCDTKTSFLNFVATMRRVIKERKINDTSLTTVYGSYDITDSDTEDSDWLTTQIERIQMDSSFKLNEELKAANVVVVSRGSRETGIIEYEDGSYDVCDPTKCAVVNCDDGRGIKSFRFITTIYAIITGVPKGVAYPVF